MATLLDIIERSKRYDPRNGAREDASRLIVPLASIDQLQQLEEAGYKIGGRRGHDESRLLPKRDVSFRFDANGDIYLRNEGKIKYPFGDFFLHGQPSDSVIAILLGIVPPYQEWVPDAGWGHLDSTIHRDKVYVYLETAGYLPNGRLFNGDVEIDPSLPIYFASRVLPEDSGIRAERGLQEIIHFFAPPNLVAYFPTSPRYLSPKALNPKRVR